MTVRNRKAAKSKLQKAAATTSVSAGEPIMLYNTEEVAERIGVSREQIAELCRGGKAPRHYLTGDVIEIYFDENSMEELRTLLSKHDGKARPKPGRS